MGSKIFDHRTTFQYGLESETSQKLTKTAKKLKIHPGWLVMQMTELLNDKPSILFDYLAEKSRR